MSVSAIIVAAGQSLRFGGAVPKQFQCILGRPLLSWTISRFELAASVSSIVVVVPEEYLLTTGAEVVDPYGFEKVRKVVVGGQSRQESVFRGLKALPVSTSLAAIHDGARPLVFPGDIDRVVETAKADRAAILATKALDTVKRAHGGYVISTFERNDLYYAQTPQVFQYDLIMEAHAAAGSETAITDDAMVVERRGFKVRIVEASRPNPKVTSPHDLLFAELLLKREGHGQD